MLRILPVLFACIILLCAACNYPRDSENTLEQVKARPVRAGLSENPPWTTSAENRSAGVEVRIVEAIASGLNTEVNWVPGTEYDLLESLKNYELDIVVAGLNEKSPWSKKVAFSRPYYNARVFVGTPDGSRLKKIDGIVVGVKEGSALANLVSKKKGLPLEVADPAKYPGAVAGYPWQLIRWGKTITEVKLREEKHVLAVPSGENAWLLHVDRFLYRQKEQIQEWVEESEDGIEDI